VRIIRRALVPATVSVDATGMVIPARAPAATLGGRRLIATRSERGARDERLAGANYGACFDGTSLQTTAPTVVAVSPGGPVTNVPVKRTCNVVSAADSIR